ncbi:hypothetical protein K501DRAFT_265946 [Backusella circina FSU 941]|nr:hypothetical protein K501DRAFT_265946 [Backusella circina FSU 941]
MIGSTSKIAISKKKKHIIKFVSTGGGKVGCGTQRMNSRGVLACASDSFHRPAGLTNNKEDGVGLIILGLAPISASRMEVKSRTKFLVRRTRSLNKLFKPNQKIFWVVNSYDTFGLEAVGGEVGGVNWNFRGQARGVYLG